ncbi:DUF6234 family protein [Streptomyces sp. NBC_01358]|uniref:DUF6234 family protein n=1 Tax=Streptomyces sp. NBC_01358 TaxID=2903837 RepID=UPI002E3000C1|nr:DUF6234 family protein [Streptomyces sp. NBC_01358]
MLMRRVGPAKARPGPLVTGCPDVVLGLLSVALEAVICAVALYLHTGPEPDRARPPSEWPAESGPPAMDWSATLTLASFTAVARLIGVVLLRHGLPLAGVVQLLAAGALCVLTLMAWHGDYRLAHPASAASAPDRSGHQRTGGRTPEPPAAAGRPQATTTIAPGAPWSPRTAAGRA